MLQTKKLMGTQARRTGGLGLDREERARVLTELLCERQYHVGEPEVLHRELTEICGTLVGAVATEPLVLGGSYGDIAVLKAICDDGTRILVFTFHDGGRIDEFWREEPYRKK